MPPHSSNISSRKSIESSTRGPPVYLYKLWIYSMCNGIKLILSKNMFHESIIILWLPSLKKQIAVAFQLHMNVNFRETGFLEQIKVSASKVSLRLRHWTPVYVALAGTVWATQIKTGSESDCWCTFPFILVINTVAIMDKTTRIKSEWFNSFNNTVK